MFDLYFMFGDIYTRVIISYHVINLHILDNLSIYITYLQYLYLKYYQKVIISIFIYLW